MQIQEHRVATCAHRRFQRLHQRFERLPRSLVRWPRFGCDRRHDRSAVTPRDVEICGHRRVRAREALARVVAERRPVAVAERRQRRGQRRERVRLVLDERDDVAAPHRGPRARYAAPVADGKADGTQDPSASAAALRAIASTRTSSDPPSLVRGRRPPAPRLRSARNRRGSERNFSAQGSAAVRVRCRHDGTSLGRLPGTSSTRARLAHYPDEAPPSVQDPS